MSICARPFHQSSTWSAELTPSLFCFWTREQRGWQGRAFQFGPDTNIQPLAGTTLMVGPVMERFSARAPIPRPLPMILYVTAEKGESQTPFRQQPRPVEAACTAGGARRTCWDVEYTLFITSNCNYQGHSRQRDLTQLSGPFSDPQSPWREKRPFNPPQTAISDW